MGDMPTEDSLIRDLTLMCVVFRQRGDSQSPGIVRATCQTIRAWLGRFDEESYSDSTGVPLSTALYQALDEWCEAYDKADASRKENVGS